MPLPVDMQGTAASQRNDDIPRSFLQQGFAVNRKLLHFIGRAAGQTLEFALIGGQIVQSRIYFIRQAVRCGCRVENDGFVQPTGQLHRVADALKGDLHLEQHNVALLKQRPVPPQIVHIAEVIGAGNDNYGVVSLLIHTDHRHAGGYPVHRPYCAGVHIGLLQISHQFTAQGVISHRIEERGVPAQAPAGIRLVGPLPAAGLSEGAAQDGFAQLRGLLYSDHKVDVRASYHQNLFQ